MACEDRFVIETKLEAFKDFISLKLTAFGQYMLSLYVKQQHGHSSKPFFVFF